MGGLKGNAQRVPQRAQAVTAGRGHEHRGQFVSVDHFVGEDHARGFQEAQVEADVMADDDGIAEEVGQVVEHVVQPRGAGDHRVANAGQAGDETGNVAGWADEGGEFVFNAPRGEAHRTDVDDFVRTRVEAGGFQVEGNKSGHGKLA